jgi:hypothetical protein
VTTRYNLALSCLIGTTNPFIECDEMNRVSMPSSEILYCRICGRRFETIESLQEHLMAEKEDQELRNKGFADG